MSKTKKPPTFRGKSLGITALTAAQLLIGVIHILSGTLLFAYENFSALPATAVYDIYTLMYGLLILFFAVCMPTTAFTKPLTESWFAWNENMTDPTVPSERILTL